MASDSDFNFEEADYILGKTYFIYKKIDDSIKVFSKMLKEGKIKYKVEIEKYFV